MIMISETTELPYITRVVPPKHRDFAVRRERLIGSLKDGLEKRVQVLWAPAGYGKTALLVEMVSELNVPVCWYSFAPEDNDPLVLLRYCFQSIRTRFPDFGAGYRPLVKGGSNTDWRAQCGSLVSALHSDIGEQLAFVFDDLHWIEGKKELEEALSLLIERAPGDIHFILASRMWPSLTCLPKLAASDEVSSLNVQDFRFSSEETAHLLTNLWSRPASLEQAQEINERTGGWAAGIILTAKTPKASVSPDAEDLRDRDMLFDYLSAEVFDELPYAIRSFLLRTSILSEFTAGFCDNLIGCSNSRGLIDQIKDRGLFLEERSSEIATFAYHDLFRDYLERRFKSESHGVYEETARHAATLYQEAGDDDAAIHHYLQCGDAAKVVEIVKQFSGSYFDQGSWSKLASWLDGLPAHIVESDSELLLLYGRILTMKVGDPTGALEQFDKLLARSHAENPEVVGKALVAKSTAYRRLGHLDLAVKVAQDGLAILLEAGCPQVHVAEAHRQLASALATQGELDLGKHHFKAALRLAREENLSLFSLICDGLAVACIESGELDQAAVYLERARTGWLKLGSEGPLAESLINLSLVYHHQREFDLAFDEAAEALQIAEAAGYPRLVATALLRKSSVQQSLGAYEDSLDTASRAMELARELLDQRLIGESTNQLGYAFWKTGQTSKALVLLNQALIEAEQAGQKYIAAIYNITLGKVYSQDRSYDRALNHLSVAQELLSDLKSPRRVAEINLFQAAISYQMGKLKEALERLNEVALLISQLGYDGFLGDEVLDVVRFGAARRVGGDTFTRLAARMTDTPSPAEETEGILSEADRTSQFPALHAMGFGSPRVLLDAHTAGDLEWRSRKAKELFFFLLCSKRPVSKEELLEALWHESSISLRACECFEVPLLLTPCWWRKRRWPVSPSYFAVGERRWWERAEATFRVTSPQGLGPPRCVCLAHQRPPTQEVVGYGDKKHNGGDFGQSSYAELGYSVKTYLGIRPFGYRAPLPVDGFGLLGGHPLPPPHYLRSILIAGLVALMLRPVPREPYRRVHAHRSLLQSSDVLPCSKAAVHEVGLRVLARSLDYLLLHGCCLACIRTLRGDPYAHDDPLGTIGSQFHIVGRSKAAIGHLHHSSLGVCGGDPCRRHLGTQDSRFGAPLAVLRSLCLRQVLQRLLDPLLSLSCGALPRPLFPPCHPPGSGCSRSCASRSTCARALSRHASSLPLPRKEAAPAPARTRIPS